VKDLVRVSTEAPERQRKNFLLCLYEISRTPR